MMDAELQNVYGLFWSAYGVGLVLFLWATQKLLRFLPFYGFAYAVVGCVDGGSGGTGGVFRYSGLVDSSVVVRRL